MSRAAAFFALVVPCALAAQTPPDLARERAEFNSWLRTAETSPFAAVARQAVGTGLTLGPTTSNIPLDGVYFHRIAQSGSVVRITGETGTRIVPRGRTLALGKYRLTADGLPGRSVLAVYGPLTTGDTATYFPYDSSLVLTVSISPTTDTSQVRVLSLEGLEVDASEVGVVLWPNGEDTVRLRVLRIPTPGTEESELMMYFRDKTSGHGTYPAGRFVTLVPGEFRRYRLDFNRARNPFCAYNSAYPCPVPWRGNLIPEPIRAGERYGR